MSRLIKTIVWVEKKPYVVIQVILAVVLLVIGLYIASPFYEGGPTTAVGVALEYPIIRILTGLGYSISGAIGLYGAVKSKIKFKVAGSFAMFLSFTFMTLLRLFTFGFTPVIWVLILGMALIAGVVYVVEANRADASG